MHFEIAKKLLFGRFKVFCSYTRYNVATKANEERHYEYKKR
ncbi:hypothetical protein MNB_SV-14-116 [hydrothermal vent metagenome]|uniref:Uncharacterized protein n=1 Tax=hydrothermal vent metagenome TaxID=652676 RepID=A0A1W1CIB6_9ZZZZ